MADLVAATSVDAVVRSLKMFNDSRQHTLDDDDDYGSDADSEILETAEEEARRVPLTHRHVRAFDKMHDGCRRHRYITPGCDENVDLVDDELFSELFRAHLKRKKVRRKIRNRPKTLDNEQEDLDTPTNHHHHHHHSHHHEMIMTNGGQNDKHKKPTREKKASKRNKDNKPVTIEQLSTKRRRLWVGIVKKEMGKAQKARNYNQKERVTNRKRIATHCMRAVRQKAMVSQRVAKETVWRAKRLTREMQAYWKRFDRVERQQKRQQEKEAEEQQKMDVQLLEAKRQQRKLNFLITQTELYAHFMASKIGGADGDGADILSKLEDPVTGRLAEIDDYDSEAAKMTARNNASQALDAHDRQTQLFDHQTHNSTPEQGDRSQPDMFNGTLKKYQLKGMNWLLNLYDQGINGILADEMGLGKTVQSLAMLAHIAECYNIWGPFLVITPASTLHNWQQEVARFLPTFKVVPYWGSPQERKVLRHFWDQSNLHKRSASFHLVITSYQLVITDFKYFNRIKWQYLVLDEAQAIKSSSSQRWKLLLEFKCRNRLLLSGTPIQNSMAELWSLLHFVMPTLFDSHEEFNDWFSKDIESSAESKSQVDEKQISRLHLILKPFMLRRIKKDVENELTDKLEVLVYCPLTIRQKLLYLGLKKKIRIEDLLQGLGSQSQSSSVTSSLMNLVMQFRKVCNHPELFERREAKSPFVSSIGPYVIPKLIFHDFSGMRASKSHMMDNMLCVLNAHNVHRSLFKKKKKKTKEYLEVTCDSPFSFLRFIDLSPNEQYNTSQSILSRWQTLIGQQSKCDVECHKNAWWPREIKTTSRFLGKRDLLIVPVAISAYNRRSSPVLSSLVFTMPANSPVYHLDVTIKAMPETLEHRLIRSKGLSDKIAPEITHVSRPDIVLKCMPCQLPSFLFDTCPKVAVGGRLSYTYDPASVYSNNDHNNCSGVEGKLLVHYGSIRQPELNLFRPDIEGGLVATKPTRGWSNIIIPDKETLVSDAGKLFVLDTLLARLKAEGHRVLIYSQMTKMIDLLEEYMYHRKHTFIRLDGSSKIHERRDMVADFQQRSDIFIFLLSTRAGGLGINLTAADTVIFYDSDWNPTVDQQAMDRAHRLGQTKQVTVYRLVCKGTIEERILQRAREKSEIQRMVIQGGTFKGLKPGELKPKEVVSLLLDDEEIERKYQAKAAAEEKTRQEEAAKKNVEVKKRNSQPQTPSVASDEVSNDGSKRIKLEDESSVDGWVSEDSMLDVDGTTTSGNTSRDITRPTSPLLDFVGDTIGPKKVKGGGTSLALGGAGKRGRPPRSLKQPTTTTTVSQQQQPGSPHKRGPGRPRIKPGGCPLNQGNRGPPLPPPPPTQQCQP